MSPGNDKQKLEQRRTYGVWHTGLRQQLAAYFKKLSGSDRSFTLISFHYICLECQLALKVCVNPAFTIQCPKITSLARPTCHTIRHCRHCCHEVSFANFSKALQEHCEVCHQADLEENHRTHEPNVVCLRNNRTWGNELHGIVCIYHCWNWGKEFFNSVLHPSVACSS